MTDGEPVREEMGRSFGRCGTHKSTNNRFNRSRGPGGFHMDTWFAAARLTEALLPRKPDSTMAAFEFNLSEPPSDPRQRELWLQHAIGFILFQDVRDYALQQIDPSLKDGEKSAAIKAINDAVYGLMMVLDGVTGSLSNESRRVNLRVLAEFVDVETDEIVDSLDLMDGDGMCLGYHGWIESDFGDILPFTAEPKSEEDRQ